MTLQQLYPTIFLAAMEICQDNGGLNRYRSEKEFLDDLTDFLFRQPEEVLERIEAFLRGLSREDFDTFCVGEEGERQVLLATLVSMEADRLLNLIFEEVV